VESPQVAVTWRSVLLAQEGVHSQKGTFCARSHLGDSSDLLPAKAAAGTEGGWASGSVWLLLLS